MNFPSHRGGIGAPGQERTQETWSWWPSPLPHHWCRVGRGCVVLTCWSPKSLPWSSWCSERGCDYHTMLALCTCLLYAYSSLFEMRPRTVISSANLMVVLEGLEGEQSYKYRVQEGDWAHIPIAAVFRDRVDETCLPSLTDCANPIPSCIWRYWVPSPWLKSLLGRTVLKAEL